MFLNWLNLLKKKVLHKVRMQRRRQIRNIDMKIVDKMSVVTAFYMFYRFM